MVAGRSELTQSVRDMASWRGSNCLVDVFDAYTLAMRQTPLRLTIVVNASELELIERAACASRASTSDFVRDAALRAARGVAREAQAEPLAVPEGGVALAQPSGRSLRRAISPAQVPLPEVIQQLTKHLGRQLVAITMGVTAADVDRWGAGTAPPPPVQELRLREAHEIWQLVVSVESPETTRAWWMGMKDGLGGFSPAEAIAADRGRAVMDVARYFVEAG